MIVLDTNVLSELMKSNPDPNVLSWLNRQAAQSVWITSVTLFESRLGLALLPPGRRRTKLARAFEDLLSNDLENRVLPFDTAAATEAAELVASRHRAGRPVDLRDAQVAGIVQARRGKVVTRNLRHFEGLQVEVVDPWACWLCGAEPRYSSISCSGVAPYTLVSTMAWSKLTRQPPWRTASASRYGSVIWLWP